MVKKMSQKEYIDLLETRRSFNATEALTEIRAEIKALEEKQEKNLAEYKEGLLSGKEINVVDNTSKIEKLKAKETKLLEIENEGAFTEEQRKYYFGLLLEFINQNDAFIKDYEEIIFDGLLRVEATLKNIEKIRSEITEVVEAYNKTVKNIADRLPFPHPEGDNFVLTQHDLLIYKEGQQYFLDRSFVSLIKEIIREKKEWKE